MTVLERLQRDVVRSPTGTTQGEERHASVVEWHGDGRGATWLCGGAAVLAVGLFWMVRGALIDDAYITLAYARNVATDLHWGLIATERANSSTSPLNVLLLGGATALLRVSGGVHPVWGLAVVFVGCATALAWWWGRVADALRLPLLVPALGVALVLFNPLVLSSTGLEVLLIPAVLVGMLSAAVRARPVAFGVLSGLAVLTRLDLLVFVLPLALASPGVRRHLARVAGVGIAVSLPWFAWSWWSFGSAIPDTFAIKTLQRSFGPWTFGNGPLNLLQIDAVLTAAAFMPALLGLVALLSWVAEGLLRRSATRPELIPAVVLGMAGVGYYAVYALLGVPPYQWWYYVPSLVALSTSVCVCWGPPPPWRDGPAYARHPGARAHRVLGGGEPRCGRARRRAVAGAADLRQLGDLGGIRAGRPAARRASARRR